MIKLIQGFDIGSPLPIDGRILLSRSEMEKCCTKGSDEYNTMPDRYFTICEEDGLLYLFKKNYVEGVDVGATFEKAVPEHTSQLENDGDGNSPYDTVASVNSKIDTLHNQISTDFIDNNELVTSLVPYALRANTGYRLSCDQDQTKHEYTFHLKNDAGVDLGEPVFINLPVESLVMDVEYDENTKSIIITLENGTQTSVPIGSLINGLVNENTFNAHKNDTTVHTNSSEKTAWNAKYSKPSAGIPKSDLVAAVQTSLGKADTAIQQSDLNTALSSYITSADAADLYQAGTNVKITTASGKKVISAKDTTYVAGGGINIVPGAYDPESGAYDPDVPDSFIINSLQAEPTWKKIVSYPGDTPMDNADLAALFNAKQDKIGDGSTTIDADDVVDTTSTHKFVTAEDKVAWNAKQAAITTTSKLSSDLVDDTGHSNKFVTASEKQTWSGKQDAITSTNKLPASNVSGLATVATSGSYTSLSNTPNLATVATSGSYADLSNKPAINNGTLTIGVSLATPEAISTGNTFTANQSSATSITIKVPSKTSHLTNDSGYQTSTNVSSTVSSAISTHNSSTSAHSDIRDLITGTNGVNSKISGIEAKIPNAATSSNQLADKQFVNDSISTSTATFQGTVTASADTESAAQSALRSITGMDNNDYAFVSCVDSAGNTKYKRYKYNGSAWEFEYTLNNSSFTSTQWGSINSGITSTLVSQITTNKNNISSNTTAIAGKQATLVSGTNIKTINSSNILGNGNLDVGTVRSVQISATSPIVSSTSSAQTGATVSTTITHANSGVTASTYGPNTVSPAYGGTFVVPKITVNAMGHITSASNSTVTLPVVPMTTITIPSDATWSAATGSAGQIGFTTTVTDNTNLANITSASTPTLDINMSTVSSTDDVDALNEAWSKIYRAVTGTKSIQFFATESLAGTALSINVKG